jgi:phosphate-selective porin OprO/OprP
MKSVLLFIYLVAISFMPAWAADATNTMATDTASRNLEMAANADKPLVIRNITFAAKLEGQPDTVANILIYEYKLALVTKDMPPMNDETRIIDAQEAFLLGKVELGKRPTFLLFTEDPRTSEHVLMDTNTTAKMMVYSGVVIRNEFPIIDINTIPEEQKKPPRGWLGYTPPPMALPSSYLDTRKWNRWESKYINGIFMAALLIDRQSWAYQSSASESQVGDLDFYNTGEIRALRFGAVGTINTDVPLVYTIFASTNTFSKGFNADDVDNISWLDWRLDIPMPAKTTLSIGKQKEPISMERSTSLVYLPMQERSAMADALLPSRNIGIVYSGTFDNDDVSWATGVFNDAIEAGNSFGESSSQVIGRMSTVAFESNNKTSLLHLGGGLRYSSGEEGYHFSTEPEFNNSPNFVDTGSAAADSITNAQLEGAYRDGPLWLMAEYVQVDIDSPDAEDLTFSGYQLAASWALSGELRPYYRKSGTFRPLPVSQSVYQGGWGAWELTTRWSDLDLTDQMVDGGEMKIASAGVNWWLTPFFQLSVNLRHVLLDKDGINGESTGINTRIVLMLE